MCTRSAIVSAELRGQQSFFTIHSHVTGWPLLNFRANCQTTHVQSYSTPQSMFSLIFQSLCVLKISFVQHFTRTYLYLERQCMKYVTRLFKTSRKSRNSVSRYCAK